MVFIIQRRGDVNRVTSGVWHKNRVDGSREFGLRLALRPTKPSLELPEYGAVDQVSWPSVRDARPILALQPRPPKLVTG